MLYTDVVLTIYFISSSVISIPSSSLHSLIKACLPNSPALTWPPIVTSHLLGHNFFSALLFCNKMFELLSTIKAYTALCHNPFSWHSSLVAVSPVNSPNSLRISNLSSIFTSAYSNFSEIVEYITY